MILINRRQFLTTGVGVAGAALGAKAIAQADPAERAPNIVMILADDLGYGDLSSYGAEDMRTPAIDGIIEGGMRFDRFYANCPVCSPTRAAFLTGRYPDLAGVPGVVRFPLENNWGRLSDDVLLPAVLKTAGYHSAIIGKWHLGYYTPDLPNDRGFDEFRGFLSGMMDDYHTYTRWGRNWMRRNREVYKPEGHATELFTDWAVDYVHARAAEETPFFLYLAYNAPHSPIQPPEDWVDRVKEREPGIDETRAKLVALIEHMDAGIGRVLTALEDSGVRDNTLVVFTSDNGGHSRFGSRNGPLRGIKGEMYEGGIRVPMGASWPGKIAPGGRSQRVALIMDLFPTFCEAAGVQAPEGIDGRSILPVLLGDNPAEEERTLFWMRREGGPQYAGQACYAVREGDWKLVQNRPFDRPVLFNLAHDPQEERPVEDKPQVYGKLLDALQAHISKTGRVPWQRDPA